MCCILLAKAVVSGGYDVEFFFFKQNTAYEMRISDWSSDVCSSDLPTGVNADGSTVIGGTGNGGTVAVNVNGSITTTGANAFGIIAQSIGGGGGLGGGPVPDGNNDGGTILQGLDRKSTRLNSSH